LQDIIVLGRHRLPSLTATFHVQNVVLVSLEYCHSLQLFPLLEDSVSVASHPANFGFFPRFPCHFVSFSEISDVIPIETAFLATSLPYSFEQLTRDPTASSSGKMAYLLISLCWSHSFPNATDTKKNELIRSIVRQYFNLSWMTASPFWPQRQSTLPLHFFVAQRLSHFVELKNL